MRDADVPVIDPDHSPSYVFLDFDGVLNNASSVEAYGGYGHAGNPRLDQVCVHLVRRLVERTGADIVISSTWRQAGLERVIGALQTCDWMEPPVVSRTKLARNAGASVSRGELITQWLSSHAHDALRRGDYLILDDEPIEGHSKENVVQTKMKKGFRIDEQREAIQKLQS